MITRFMLTLIIFLIPVVFSVAQHSFVGVKSCVICHKSEKAGEQKSIWENSKHSKAYETLLTDKAALIATQNGFTTKPNETPDCLKCHATGYNVNESFLSNKFNIEDGVQCETCHGPGSDYKKKSIMQNKDKAVENGLMLYENPEDLCITCHNAESPTAVDFIFAESWEKIKHEKPE